MAKPPASRRSGRVRSPRGTGPAAPEAVAGRPEGADARLRKRFERLAGHDDEVRARGYRLIAGVDEAGRGALAGPVVSAAVILPERCGLVRIYDSKALTETERESLFHEIAASALALGIGVAHPAVIDRDNILRATLATMHRAVGALRPGPDLVLVDGREAIQWPGPVVPLVKGDSRSLCVAAASIVAKVTRDRVMRRLHRRYPDYNFERNKGYGTRDHLEALAAHGAAEVHRRSFLGKIVANNLSMF